MTQKINFKKNLISLNFFLIEPVMAFFRRKAPKAIPKELFNAYTLNGKIEVASWYFNDIAFSHRPNIYTEEMVNCYINKIKNNETLYYNRTNTWLYEALREFPIKGQSVAIMGSELPLYECICIYYGGQPVTIEYKPIICQDARLKAMTPEQYDAQPVQFDRAFSISSFEHDGLGRYGDPLNPNGDLEAMEKMKSLLRPGGLLYLAVPVGKDKLVWNAHRVYGRLRLPILLNGWKVVGKFGFDESLMDMGKKENEYEGLVQPVFVLKNGS